MPRRRPRVHGLFVVDKPAGMTSHDVVLAIRKLTREHQVGHAGTLDPLATGVLVVAVGAATRLVEFMVGHPKVYRFTVRLGVQTETDDRDGRVIAEKPVPPLTVPAIREVLDRFVGEIEQVPPRYAAIRFRGKRLYEWARAGVEVPREPRRVQVHRLELISWQPPDLVLEAFCSAGTYVRALARDIAEALGTVGHVTALRRLASGPFRVEEAVPLPELLATDDWSRYLRPPDAGLVDMPILEVTAEQARALLHGRPIHGHPPQDDASLRRAYVLGHFFGLVVWDSERHAWRPRKIFPQLMPTL